MTTATSRAIRLAADAAGLLRLAWENLRVRWRDWRTWEPPQYVDVHRLRRVWTQQEG
jgi:hypothetical protein